MLRDYYIERGAFVPRVYDGVGVVPDTTFFSNRVQDIPYREYYVDRGVTGGFESAPAASYDPYYVDPLPKLYVHKVSTNCLGPWLLLKEAGIPFELIELDLARGDTHTPEFLSMNPMGKVPTYLETDGTVIFESNSIMRFICEKYCVPEHFYPHDVNLRGRIEMALDWRQTVLYPNVVKVAYPSLGMSKDRSKVKEGQLALTKDLKVLTDYFLRETPFIGGALPSIADYSVALPLLYLYSTEYQTPVKVREYLDNLASKTPSWNEVTDALKNFMASLK
jgi:glutathione S-transferase